MTDIVPEELLINLEPSIEHLGKTITELALREPTIGEVSKAVVASANAGDFNIKMTMHLLVTITGHSIQIIEKLPVRVFRKASNYLMGFTEGTQGTTES